MFLKLIGCFEYCIVEDRASELVFRGDLRSRTTGVGIRWFIGELEAASLLSQQLLWDRERSMLWIESSISVILKSCPVSFGIT